MYLFQADRQTAIYSRIVPSGLQKSNGDEFQNDAIFICIGNDDIHVVHRELPQSIHICTMAEKKKKYFNIRNELILIKLLLFLFLNRKKKKQNYYYFIKSTHFILKIIS